MKWECRITHKYSAELLLLCLLGIYATQIYFSELKEAFSHFPPSYVLRLDHYKRQEWKHPYPPLQWGIFVEGNIFFMGVKESFLEDLAFKMLTRSVSINISHSFVIWKVLISCFHSWNKWLENSEGTGPALLVQQQVKSDDDWNRRNHDNMIMSIKDESAHREKTIFLFLLTLMVSNQSSGCVWISVQEADAHLLFDIHFFQYLGELAEGDTCISISVSFLDGSVCNASKLLIRYIHANHHSQNL